MLAAADAKRIADALTFFVSTITVTVEAGSTVICEGGGRTQTKTSDGSVVFTVISAATYTITATTGDEITSGTVEITASEQEKIITLEYFRSTITVTVESGSTVVCEGGGRTQTQTSDGSVIFTVISAATYIITATTGDETTSGTVEITASEQEKTITLEYFRSTITVNIAAGAYVTCTDGTAALDGISNGSVVFEVHGAAAWRIAASMNGRTVTGTATITASGQSKTISIVYVKIYGVSWDGSATTKLSRTDDAGLFADPVPAVGNGAGFSPFDNCYPWSGMTKVTGGENILVKIPKCWVKVQHNQFRVQIAPKTLTDITTVRSGIAALGAGYWQADFALQLTWWYLYIVEFADWDGQTAIGRGNCDSGEKINTGGTDSMSYHTGRAASTDEYVAVQYRNIENLWGNVRDWRDGIIFDEEENVCTYNNPADFKNTYNGAGVVVSCYEWWKA